MIKGIRILNFDDSVTYQRKLVEQFSPQVVDLKSLTRVARFWASEMSRDQISSTLQPSNRNALTFLGSGDYHHVTSILLKQFIHPITLIIFDHHPDWHYQWPKVSMVSWVNHALEQVNIVEIIQIGVGTNDLKAPWKKARNLKILKAGKLKMYGYHYMPMLEKILNNLHTEDVYVSIDKNCLTKNENLSNWDEGQLSLDNVLNAIQTLGKHKNLVGMDVVGEYSLPLYDNPLKRLFNKVKHPSKFTAYNKSLAEIDAVNEAANIRIASSILKNP